MAIFVPNVMSYNDYYPFEGGTYRKCPVDIFSERASMRIGTPTRHESSDGYRYGFNGKENDNELKGTGNSIDFGARMYDPRLGRWFKLDDLSKEYQSDYSYVADNPIIFVDIDGKDDYYFDRVTKKTTIIYNGKPNNYYIAKWTETETIVKGGTMTTMGFSHWEKHNIDDAELKALTISNKYSVFGFVIKHSKTKEKVNEVWDSYHSITEKDKAKVIAATVGAPLLIIGAVEIASSAAISEAIEMTSAYVGETVEEIKTVSGAIKNVRKLNELYENIQDGKKIANDVIDGNYDDAKKDVLGLGAKKVVSKLLYKVTDLRYEDSSESLIEGVKLVDDLWMKLEGSAIDAIIDDTKTNDSNTKQNSDNNNTKEQNETND